MSILPTLVAGLIGIPVGSLLNRLIVREPGYVIVDPADLADDDDRALLDELEPAPAPRAVPLVAIVRPGQAWRRWFAVTEAVTAAGFALTLHRLGWGSPTAAVLVLVAALITLSATDLRVFRIPDRINLPATGIAMAAIIVASIERGVPGAIGGAVAGAVTYFGFLLLAHLVSPRGMGLGDVKLAVLMGLYLGWFGWTGGSIADQYVGVLRLVLFGAGFGSVAGVVTGTAYAAARRSTKAVFPYGPSLAVGCLGVVLWSSTLT